MAAIVRPKRKAWANREVTVEEMTRVIAPCLGLHPGRRCLRTWSISAGSMRTDAFANAARSTIADSPVERAPIDTNVLRRFCGVSRE